MTTPTKEKLQLVGRHQRMLAEAIVDHRIVMVTVQTFPLTEGQFVKPPKVEFAAATAVSATDVPWL